MTSFICFSWDTYINLEATVKNMLTSLRAVAELQNPAIRERHWDQLMRTTKVIVETVYQIKIMYIIITCLYFSVKIKIVNT